MLKNIASPHTQTYTHLIPIQYIANIHSYYISYPGKQVPLLQPDHKHKPIPLSEFGTHVTMLHKNGNQGFKAEYEVSELHFVTLDIINVAST